MKVCVPVSENKGMESVPFGHFGSAPEFVICDLDSNEVKSIGYVSYLRDKYDIKTTTP